MIDPFLFEHQELKTLKSATNTLCLEPDTIAHAIRFARFPYAMPTASQLQITGHVQTHEKIFELHLATTNVRYMLNLTPIEKLLFEIIALHKLSKGLEHAQATDLEYRSHTVLGCMIQHRLTRLLLEIDSRDRKAVFQLGRASGIDQTLWQTDFVGATSCARAIGLFLELTSCRLYLPTVFEDIMLGVDLIILSADQKNWCVSIKTGRMNSGIYLEHVHTRPSNEEPAFYAETRRRIFDGSAKMEHYYPYAFQPCRIVVGKRPEIINIDVEKSDLEIAKRFIGEKRLLSHLPRWPQKTNDMTTDSHVA